MNFFLFLVGNSALIHNSILFGSAMSTQVFFHCYPCNVMVLMIEPLLKYKTLCLLWRVLAANKETFSLQESKCAKHALPHSLHTLILRKEGFVDLPLAHAFDLEWRYSKTVREEDEQPAAILCLAKEKFILHSHIPSALFFFLSLNICTDFL